MTGFYESGLGGTLTPHSIEEHTDTDFGTLATGDLLQWNAITARWENVAPSTLYPAMNDITDASVPSPSDGQVIQWVAANQRWEAATLGGGGATDLNGLTDVTLTTPTNGQIMVYNGSQWVNQAATSGDLDGLTDVVITTPTVGDRIEWDGANWVNVPTGSIGNPLTIGTGINGTSAGLILDAGNNTSGDLNYIEFQTNSTKRYSISEANSVAGHFLNFRDSTDTNIFSVSTGLFAIQQGTEFRLVNENNPARHWIFQATNDGSGYNSLSISDSVGSNQSIDIAATVDVTGSITASGNIASSALTVAGRILEVGSFGIITQGSFATSSIVLNTRTLTAGSGLTGGGDLSANRSFAVDSTVVRTTGTQSIGGTKTFTSSLNTNTVANTGTIASTNLTPSGSALECGSFGIIQVITSDIRKKENITESGYGLEAVKAIETVEFDWIETGAHDVGFIAQQLIDVIPAAVPYNEEDDTYGIRQGPIISALVKAVQELSARVEELENGV